MSLREDWSVLRHLILPKRKGATHGERLESFYQGQADQYDRYRKRLLHGREELIGKLPFPAGGIWLDMGAGTGSNAEAAGGRREALRRVLQVDLCAPLLRVAGDRIRERGWSNVETVVADATEYRSPEAADLVTFSYSLTMIPDWFKALDRAWENLKPGGWIGVVDFYVSRKWPDPGYRRHSGFVRTVWPAAFGWDNVFPSPDHLPYLRHRFRQESFDEGLGRIPYLPGLRSPWYSFIGRRSSSPELDPT